ncbi:hypothetical protein Mvan_3972 [Mycolicibacterium vanbaalenii PYR-1]|uniref:Uncharacterized protein n=1 Tax=Mycolicibacterium vanbaalenii (strain DSM 7251 / JCM 13017 / BCRC 16820 / KCTC 9966 / NRRL B-24157 / PYR-1) TaxID=350058 RepID=A1TC49_MYCVP|nr:hypothetical protein Mvan_3972 [Mycolicibacterium vanbaalenii PYR-1]
MVAAIRFADYSGAVGRHRRHQDQKSLPNRLRCVASRPAKRSERLSTEEGNGLYHLRQRRYDQESAVERPVRRLCQNGAASPVRKSLLL